MKKANKRSKGSRSGQTDPTVTDQDLVDLLEDVTHALDQATAQIIDAGAQPPVTARSAPWLGEPCGPSLGSMQSGRALSDPMLLDRYQGLLARSGLVAGTVHHLPS
ncbi:hypothetical protein, partial [Bradyrhizobium sp. NBAIM08]|uniref:hypothetical protein n=1 Tax=Bradyrhizobium sp. NBAIM08 TaxID=2793815 RepID=UPI001CD680FA